ncbi:MAG: polyisoprenoid-binding protein [Frankiaceae bacterium]|nr:polyisoprenoid-binding protein [Frankiaceae bacterium]
MRNFALSPAIRRRHDDSDQNGRPTGGSAVTQTSGVTTQQELTGEYDVDPAHSRIGFVARHAMVSKVRGHFSNFRGRAYLDFSDPTKSSAELVVDIPSIDTGNADRDAHLRANDFFDAQNHSQMTFRSTQVDIQGDDSYQMTGDLTLKGRTRPVTIDWEYLGSAKDPFGNTRVGFSGRATINRRDWGVEWNAPLETGGVLVGDKVQLELEVSAIKASSGTD